MVKLTVYYHSGSVVEYKYEGDGEYNGKVESAKERAIRHMSNSEQRYKIEDIVEPKEDY